MEANGLSSLFSCCVLGLGLESDVSSEIFLTLLVFKISAVFIANTSLANKGYEYFGVSHITRNSYIIDINHTNTWVANFLCNRSS